MRSSTRSRARSSSPRSDTKRAAARRDGYLRPVSILDRLQRDLPLAPRTTLGLGGPARFLVEVRDDAELVEALAWAEAEGQRVAVIGGGSNLVVSDAGWDGLVIAMASRGVETLDDAGGRVHLRVQAGEPWDALVARVVDEDLAGIECLAGIPGQVGATPIQNVGAYGQEVSSVLTRVHAYDREAKRFVTIEAADCAFGYRDSRFKRAPEGQVVTSVELVLHRGGRPTIAYAELEKKLGERAGSATLAEVRQTVIALRRAKSMVLDPRDPDTRSAGSFFTNPIVDDRTRDEVLARAKARGLARVPTYAQPDGRTKLAAGWLIEQAGVTKGLRRGAVGISSQHALALVHHGGGTTRELLALADDVVARVRDAWGVTLEREPVLLG